MTKEKNNFKVILNFLIKCINYLAHASWAIPLVLVSRLLYPVLKISFGVSQSHRIGHFIPDSLEELIRVDKKNRTQITFWSATTISNIQWYKMLKNYLHISPLFKYPVFWNRYIPKSQRHTSVMSTNSSRDPEGKFFSSLVKPKMINEDIEICLNWLQELGWKGEPYICLLSRDSAYLNYLDASIGKPMDRSYHSYRNSEIETYKLAVNYLLDNDYWVFRMGNITEKKLDISHKHFLDYSQSDKKSDLLDIYLFTHCTGVISCGSGIDALSQAYAIPALIVNGLPLQLASTFFNTIWVSKNLFWIHNNKELTLKEYIENDFLTTDEYINAGIRIVDLNQEEILEATKELVYRIENKVIENELDLAIQNKFLELLMKSENFSKNHSFIHPNFKIGKNWIYGKNLE